MPEVQTRLIDAAVRPLADNAEIKLRVECYWFKQDKRMRFDPAYPSLFRYEYEISQQARRELRQVMGYGE